MILGRRLPALPRDGARITVAERFQQALAGGRRDLECDEDAPRVETELVCPKQDRPELRELVRAGMAQ